MIYSNYGPHQPYRDEVSAMPGEDFDAWVGRVRSFAVIEPGLLAEEQRRLAAEAQRRGEMAGRSRRRVVKAVRWLDASLLALGASVVLHYLTGLSWWLVTASGVAIAVSTGAVALAKRLERSDSASAAPGPALGRDQLVRIAEVDGSCRELLTRAQRAIDEVLSSTVYSRNLLDQSAGEAALRRQEWETADALRNITSLRAESDANPAVGPQTAEVREPQQRALTTAQEYMAARVSATERYAAQVKIADAAFIDYEGAIKASDLNDRYLDLLARTAADEHAIEELRGLTEQAAAARQVFEDSIGHAHQAGAAVMSPLNAPLPAGSAPAAEPVQGL
jgi:hypothetical protein